MRHWGTSSRESHGAAAPPPTSHAAASSGPSDAAWPLSPGTTVENRCSGHPTTDRNPSEGPWSHPVCTPEQPGSETKRFGLANPWRPHESYAPLTLLNPIDPISSPAQFCPFSRIFFWEKSIEYVKAWDWQTANENIIVNNNNIRKRRMRLDDHVKERIFIREG